MELSELDLNRQLYKTQPQTLETLGADQVASNLAPPPSNAVASGNTVTDVNTNAEQLDGAVIAPGTIPAATLDIANFGWTQTCVFSVTDLDTVAWGAGTFTSANGVSIYSIGAGNTGNMAAKTYVYLDINVSTTAYQTTTVQATAIGIGKVFIALCENGAATATYNLVQASQIVSDNILANTISAQKMNVAILSAITADLGSITAGTITVVSGGNTVAFTPGSAVAIISGPTGTPNFSLTSTGYLTAIGLTSLNMKAYTDFETAGRFIASGGAGTNPPAFGNTGATIITSAVATTFCKILWQANGFVFNNNASFTASLQCATGFAAGDGVGFIGLGNPTIDGSGFTETGTNYCGFEIKKASGVTTIIPVQCDGGGTVTFGSSFATLSNGTWLELFIKMRSGAIDYYVRVNGGTLSAPTTLSATLPSGADNNIQFSLSNKGSANDFSYILGSASYEH